MLSTVSPVMVGAEAASPQPITPVSDAIRTSTLSACRISTPAMNTGFFIGSATAMGSIDLTFISAPPHPPLSSTTGSARGRRGNSPLPSSNRSDPVIWDVDERGVAHVVFNRPDVNNAYDGDFIQGFLAAMDALATNEGLRVIVIKGNGRHFQAGADLKWIDAVRTASSE